MSQWTLLKDRHGWSLVDSDDSELAIVHDDRPDAESDKSAALIAAAPDLLEALEAAQDWLTDGIAEGYPDSLRDKIEAAVARARGEE